MHLSELEYQLLYALYSFPNIILPLFGGFLIDRLGKRQGIILFAFIITVGQFLFAVSTHAVRASEGFGKFLMIFSRLIFGLGGENLSVVESAFVATWFKGKELSFALGVDLCVSRLFSAVNDATQPLFYDIGGYKLSLGFWIGFILCLLSLGCAVIIILVDIKADKSCVQIEVEAMQTTEQEEKDDDEEIEDQVNLSELWKLPRSFWLLTGSCVMIYMSFMSFMNVASDFLQTRFSFSPESAGLVLVKNMLISHYY